MAINVIFGLTKKKAALHNFRIRCFCEDVRMARNVSGEPRSNSFLSPSWRIGVGYLYAPGKGLCRAILLYICMRLFISTRLKRDTPLKKR